MIMACSRAGIGAVLGCILISACFAGEGGAKKQEAGFYLIAAEAATRAALPAPDSDQQVVRYDYKFLRDTVLTQPRYLLLPRKADVPLVLAKEPELNPKGENGLPEVRLELTPEAAKNLETLSREHLGRQVAFMIEGEPVTVHKIRSLISGGQFRLSRCTDNACRYIYGRLTSKP
jgi:preprotein translocase subunit SecD